MFLCAFLQESTKIWAEKNPWFSWKSTQFSVLSPWETTKIIPDRGTHQPWGYQQQSSCSPNWASPRLEAKQRVSSFHRKKKQQNHLTWSLTQPDFFRSGPPKLTRTGKVRRLLCTLVVKATMCFLPSGKPTALAGVTFETGHFWYFLPSRFAEKSTGTLQARIGERLPQTEKMIWFSRDFFEPSLNPLWMSTMSIATSHYQRVFNSLLSAAWDATVVSASAQVGDWFGFFLPAPTTTFIKADQSLVGGEPWKTLGRLVDSPRPFCLSMANLRIPCFCFHCASGTAPKTNQNTAPNKLTHRSGILGVSK